MKSFLSRRSAVPGGHSACCSSLTRGKLTSRLGDHSIGDRLDPGRDPIEHPARIRGQGVIIGARHHMFDDHREGAWLARFEDHIVKPARDQPIAILERRPRRVRDDRDWPSARVGTKACEQAFATQRWHSELGNDRIGTMHHRESQTLCSGGHSHGAMAKVLEDERGDPAGVLIGINDEHPQS